MKHLPFTILQPKNLPARSSWMMVSPGSDFSWVIMERRHSGDVMALDFETKGDWGEPDSFPVGCALSDSRGSVYIDFQQDSSAFLKLMNLLNDARVPLIAHNVFFDAGWCARAGFHLNWEACTYSLYKLLATEGWFGQRWGLKDAMQDLLGWEDTNEEGRDRWLIENGYAAGSSLTPKPSYWEVQTPKGTRWKSPQKGEMWRVPASILGPYSMLDADACWLLYTEVFQPALKRFQGLKDFYYKNYPSYTALLIEQRLRGIQVDLSVLDNFHKEIQDEGRTTKIQLLSLPDIKPYISDWNAKHLAEVAKTEPRRSLARKPLGKEPARLTKRGTESSSWAKWDARRTALSGPDALSKSWINWRARMDAALLVSQDPTGGFFNLNSGDHKRALLYDHMKFSVKSRTDTGEPGTDEEALVGMGATGQLLLTIQDKEKLGQFCTQTRGLLDGKGIIRPGFRVPGTLTGRLSGKNPNVQQMPGNVGYLSAWVARPGFKLVICDVVSLENYVLAELSRDAALWGLYGPDAREGQDAYLYNAAQLPVIGPRITATGYNPHTATLEETSRAKKECKVERKVGKRFTLSANYGAGAPKIQNSLAVLDGVDLPLSQVEEMHAGFWSLYAGIKDWEKELQRQWRGNKGWVLNGLGRPLGVDQEARKDLVNRVVQSTGHGCLVLMIAHARRLLNARGIEWYPWIVDLHDAIYLEVREDQAAAALDILEHGAYDALNEELGWVIKLKGAGKICDSWADDKRE